MISEQHAARILRDRLRRKLSGPELAVCEVVADGHELVRNSADWITFQQLKTEFSRDIADEVNREPEAPQLVAEPQPALMP